MKFLFFNILFLFIFFSSCKSQSIEDQRIIGLWKVSNSEILPFALPDCENINKEDDIIFEVNNTLVIKNNDQVCGTFHYSLDGHLIQVIISDMVFNLQIVELYDNKMILSSKYLPRQYLIDWKEEYVEFKKKGYLIELKK